MSDTSRRSFLRNSAAAGTAFSVIKPHLVRGAGKAQLKAGLMMSLESSSARAEQMARQMLLHGRVLPTSELIDCVDRVTAEEVMAVARRLRRSEASVTVVGAGRKSDDLASRAGLRLKCVA